MQKKHDPVFQRVIAKSQSLGIYDILSLYQDWNTELVGQFCATSWRSGDGFESTINFAMEGHHFEFKVTKLPTIFGLAPDYFHRMPISTKWSISDNELAPHYYLRNEHNYGTTHRMLPEYYLFNHIFHNTLTPKRGDRTSIRGSTRNLLLAILDGQPLPCINVFFWSELMFVLNHGTQYVIYPPYIQWIINLKTDMEFGYDGKHGPYQPHLVRAPVVPPDAAATAGSSTAPLLLLLLLLLVNLLL
jgi:hypothetical protein